MSRLDGGAVGPGQTRTMQVIGQGGVPSSGVSAVVLNATATNATTSSYLTVFPAGTARAPASNLNFAAGEQRGNRGMVPVGAGGQVSIFNAAGSVDVVVDVNGWFTDDSSAAGGSRFTTISPQRILDTRHGFGAILDGGVATVQFTDTASIGVTALVTTVTAVGTTVPSYLMVWPSSRWPLI